MKNQKLKLANTKIEVDTYTGHVSVIFYATRILELSKDIAVIYGDNTSKTTIKRINQVLSHFNIKASVNVIKGLLTVKSEDVVLHKDNNHMILIGSHSLV